MSKTGRTQFIEQSFRDEHQIFVREPDLYSSFSSGKFASSMLPCDSVVMSERLLNSK